jgi:hypothetical protein
VENTFWYRFVVVIFVVGSVVTVASVVACGATYAVNVKNGYKSFKMIAGNENLGIC